MNKDLEKDEMSKKLESEYKNLILQDVPDLWSRIEANLEPKYQAFSGDSSTQDNLKNKNSEKKSSKVVSFKKHFKTWGTVAAACACVAIAIPVFMGSVNNKNNFVASEDMAVPNYEVNDEVVNKNSNMNEIFMEDLGDQLEAAQDDKLMPEENLDFEFAGAVNEQVEYTLTVEILDKEITDEEIIYTALVLIADEDSGLQESEEIIIHDTILEGTVGENAEFEYFHEYEIKVSPDVNNFGENIYRLINN